MALPMRVSSGGMMDPFEQMRQEFGSMLSRFGWPWRETETLLTPYGVDIRQDADHIYVEADLPGFTKDELDVRIENQMLTISGEHKMEKKEEKKDYLLHERAERTCSRSFTLPTAVDEKSVDAKYQNGVLNITLNKKEESKLHKVMVH